MKLCLYWPQVDWRGNGRGRVADVLVLVAKAWQGTRASDAPAQYLLQHLPTTPRGIPASYSDAVTECVVLGRASDAVTEIGGRSSHGNQREVLRH